MLSLHLSGVFALRGFAGTAPPLPPDFMLDALGFPLSRCSSHNERCALAIKRAMSPKLLPPPMSTPGNALCTSGGWCLLCGSFRGWHTPPRVGWVGRTCPQTSESILKAEGVIHTCRERRTLDFQLRPRPKQDFFLRLRRTKKKKTRRGGKSQAAAALHGSPLYPFLLLKTLGLRSELPESLPPSTSS